MSSAQVCGLVWVGVILPSPRSSLRCAHNQLIWKLSYAEVNPTAHAVTLKALKRETRYLLTIHRKRLWVFVQRRSKLSAFSLSISTKTIRHAPIQFFHPPFRTSWMPSLAPVGAVRSHVKTEMFKARTVPHHLPELPDFSITQALAIPSLTHS